MYLGIISLRNRLYPACTKAVGYRSEFVWIPGDSKHHHHFPVTGGLSGGHDPGPSHGGSDGSTGEQVVTSKLFEYIFVKNILSLTEYSYWSLDLWNKSYSSRRSQLEAPSHTRVVNQQQYCILERRTEIKTINSSGFHHDHLYAL